MKGVYHFVNNNADVATMRPPLTMHMSPGDVLPALNVEFENNLDGHEMVATISRLESLIKSEFPEIKQIDAEAGSFSKIKK